MQSEFPARPLTPRPSSQVTTAVAEGVMDGAGALAIETLGLHPQRRLIYRRGD